MSWLRTVDIKAPMRREQAGEIQEWEAAAEIAVIVLADPTLGSTKAARDLAALGTEESYDRTAFNSTLDRLYDYADSHRIWLGV